MKYEVFPTYVPLDRQEDLPEVISLSGGRSSATALMCLINGGFGTRPNDYALFQNMGLEDETCLQFLDDIEQQTGIEVKRLEFTLTDKFMYELVNPEFSYVDFYNCKYTSIDQILNVDKLRSFDYAKSPNNFWYKDGYSHRVNSIRMVTHESASRIGEPFCDLFLYKAAIRIMKGKGLLLFSASHRWCTGDGKEKVNDRWLANIGIREFISYKGMRHDEPDRVHKVKQKNESQDKIWYDCPLDHLKITKQDVFMCWACQPIDLGLQADGSNTFADVKGNCKYCHLKKLIKKMFLIQQGEKGYLFFMQCELLANNYNGDVDAVCRQHGTWEQIEKKSNESETITIDKVLSDGEIEISCFNCTD